MRNVDQTALEVFRDLLNMGHLSGGGAPTRCLAREPNAHNLAPPPNPRRGFSLAERFKPRCCCQNKAKRIVYPRSNGRVSLRTTLAAPPRAGLFFRSARLSRLAGRWRLLAVLRPSLGDGAPCERPGVARTIAV